ncbi:glutathione S-transferase C-terminal domain-containing protein (plasmid) [Agrobacterium leguminum]|uniref:glutathione S-transferase family protein n=1 Tax=Agrobacterium leguminum TaxID=2792015 RepID=UPI0030CAB520
MMIDGNWSNENFETQPTDGKGAFRRQESKFRNWIVDNESRSEPADGDFIAEVGRYHLFVSLSCPWASRSLLTRKLKRLEEVITVSVVEPELSQEGWKFGPQSYREEIGLAAYDYLHQVYALADSSFTGRVTVPVLWDKQRRTIVNNESADIIRILDTGFSEWANNDLSLCPDDLSAQIDVLNGQLYKALNNGVYRAGFAQTQSAYDEAVHDVFEMLDTLDTRIGDAGPFIFGERFTEADIRLFVTLVRFDAVYYGLFKCNFRRLTEYINLTTYLTRILSIPGVRDTVDMSHIKRGYYSIRSVNPSGIVPIGPYDLSLTQG